MFKKLIFEFRNVCEKVAFFSDSKIFLNSHRIKNALLLSLGSVGISLYVTNSTKIIAEEYISETIPERIPYNDAIEKARDLLQRKKDEYGIPGIVVGVSVDGKMVWEEGLGYADVENRVLCTPDTVMRIASISKSITMAITAKLWEQGQLDIDKPIQDFVPSFPQKTFNGKPVVITTRHLLSHLSGIRHYKKTSKNTILKDFQGTDKNDEFNSEEYFITEKFHDTQSALSIFKNDPLVVEPGSKFLYTTFGWTVVSAIIESVTKEKFPLTLKKLFKTLGMKHTYLDENDVIIYNRSRNYMKNKSDKLVNALYVDNSYKWAGGGLLSTVGDLLKFGNAMMYSFQTKPGCATEDIIGLHNKKSSISSPKNDGKAEKSRSQNSFQSAQYTQQLPGYLKSETVESMWSLASANYGLGWFVNPKHQVCGFCDKQDFKAFHSGGAIGGVSCLVIIPEQNDFNAQEKSTKQIILPKGVVVAILANLHKASITETAFDIAQLFSRK